MERTCVVLQRRSHKPFGDFYFLKHKNSFSLLLVNTEWRDQSRERGESAKLAPRRGSSVSEKSNSLRSVLCVLHVCVRVRVCVVRGLVGGWLFSSLDSLQCSMTNRRRSRRLRSSPSGPHTYRTNSVCVRASVRVLRTRVCLRACMCVILQKSS